MTDADISAASLLYHFVLVLPANVLKKSGKLVDVELSILVSIGLQKTFLPTLESSIWVITNFVLELLQADKAILVGIESIHDGFSNLLLALVNKLMLFVPADVLEKSSEFFDIELT
eukprot:CAMPEP_0169378510 /NCGR_PEP_ID=MMETSP1017-20121227/39803_1 /TAXON_ID=342587 /ORGANISM="Karlodinium micrum, Strain CCMP2283" /LENGTH=115 /DNA_ID=CAMNT_0009477747 /DNA_START=17 /DNA_END=359 /DNA_ORIENTATION=+